MKLSTSETETEATTTTNSNANSGATVTSSANGRNSGHGHGSGRESSGSEISEEGHSASSNSNSNGIGNSESASAIVQQLVDLDQNTNNSEVEVEAEAPTIDTDEEDEEQDGEERQTMIKSNSGSKSNTSSPASINGNTKNSNGRPLVIIPNDKGNDEDSEILSSEKILAKSLSLSLAPPQSQSQTQSHSQSHSQIQSHHLSSHSNNSLSSKTGSNVDNDIGSFTVRNSNSQQQLLNHSSNLRVSGETAVLSEAEEQSTREFLELVNGARVDEGISPLSWNAGVKFLMARKFNVRRALELYEQHHKARLEEGLVSFDPNTEPLKSELLSSKFTVLPSRDVGGAAIAVFTARSHQPSSVPHEQTLKGVVYQLDAALENPQTQRCGLVFIYDMSDSKYSNFDYDLSIKILTLLKGGYPARLKKVLIVTAPLWFRAPYKILRLFLREKLRDRVFTVSVPQLAVHIPHPSLPRQLGGQLEVNHLAWLDHCHRVLSTTDLWGGYDESHSQRMASNNVRPQQATPDATDKEVESSISNGHQQDNISKKLRRNGQSTPSPAPNSSGSSGFSDDDSLPFDERSGLTLSEFVEHLKQKGRRGLLDEYAEIISKTPDGSFNISRLRGNVCKNRYSDVLCYDHTRVVLTSEGEPGEGDYINANFVDGYKQKHAFISTQGPLPRTFGDFWKMIWEQTCVLIVMTTRTVERGRTKCGQYWPAEQGSVSPTYEGFKIENLGVETQPDLETTRLLLTNTKTNESRSIAHLQFLSWPDYGVPSSPAAMLHFLVAMRNEQRNGVESLGSKWDGNPLGPPIVAHCSAGIGRTGTLITMDICVRRHEDQGTVDVQGTVERIRSQRAYSIQVPEQYLFCHAAMIEYAKWKHLLTDAQLDGVPDLLAEDDSDDCCSDPSSPLGAATPSKSGHGTPTRTISRTATPTKSRTGAIAPTKIGTVTLTKSATATSAKTGTATATPTKTGPGTPNSKSRPNSKPASRSPSTPGLFPTKPKSK